MTIKMDHVVCLILPKSLVCIQEPNEDIFLVWRWLGCKQQKPIELAQVKEVFISMDTWEHCLEIQSQEMQPGLKRAGILVLIVMFCPPLASLLHAFVQLNSFH